MSTRFKNLTAGAKGLRSKNGALVMVEPGELTPEGFEAGEEPNSEWFGSPDAGDEERQQQLEQQIEGGESVGDQLQQLRQSFADREAALLDRAETAERERDELKQQLASLDRDGDGKAGGSTPSDPPSLSGKNKAELVEIGKAEGVDVSEDLTVAEIKDAIEAKRAA